MIIGRGFKLGNALETGGKCHRVMPMDRHRQGVADVPISGQPRIVWWVDLAFGHLSDQVDVKNVLSTCADQRCRAGNVAKGRRCGAPGLYRLPAPDAGGWPQPQTLRNRLYAEKIEH